MKHQIMKNIIILILVLVFANISDFINAQGVTVTDEASYTPDSSAILDVNSTSRGLLPPRMTTEERDAIINPVEGLMIFNTNSIMLELYDGISWGSVTGKFFCGSSQVSDDEGNAYSTIQIGSQCWITKNLNTGALISGSIDQSNNSTIEKYCYNNDENNCAIYGALYQWDEMMQYLITESTRGICPEGWHLPSDAEWCTLEQRIDPTVSCSGTDWRGTDGGTKLKQGGSSGFEALMAGRYISAGAFGSSGTGGYFWASTEGSSGAWERYLYDSDDQVGRNDQNKNYGLSVRCIYDENTSKLPTVTTCLASNIEVSSANVSGEITDLGIEGAIITHYGHCWSTSPDPTLSDAFSDLGSSDTVGTFISNLNYLEESTTYYVRAYAENSEGLSYGAEINFTTLSTTSCPGVPTVIYGGQVYNTVLIGSQCWMKENLNIGIMINGNDDQTNNSIIEKYCYNNNTSNCDIYGGLYKWDEMMQYVTTEGTQGICPTGWHIPTDAEWCTLANVVDAGTIPCNTSAWIGIDAGDNLKETGTDHWGSGNAGNNSSGFTALPAGRLDWPGAFYYWHYQTNFMTSTEWSPNSNTNWVWGLSYSLSLICHTTHYKIDGYSVRCVKN